MRIAEEDKMEKKNEGESERQSPANETKIENISWKWKNSGEKYYNNRKIKFEI